MLFSVAILLLCGFALGGLLQRLRLPGLLGMMLTGVLLGPHGLNLIAPSILAVSTELRMMALTVILIRAGLGLEPGDLKRVGRPAALLCFVPATMEAAAVTLLAPVLLGIPRLEAAILGAVLAAVSPAVVVPRMLRLMEDGYGRERRVPQMILAGASVDDIYVIVLFTSLMGMYRGEGIQLAGFARVPVSILLGLGLGVAAGALAVWLLQKLRVPDTAGSLVLLCVCFLFVALENAVEAYVAVSGLLAVMALGCTVLKADPKRAERLSRKYAQMWVGAELLLFVLVGAAVDIGRLRYAGWSALALVLAALLVRMAGVLLCMVKTELTPRERLFAAIAYLPKATVQAAIGGIPLAQGVASGETILAVAVLAIAVTAPLGAIGVDRSYKRLLTRGEDTALPPHTA